MSNGDIPTKMRGVVLEEFTTGKGELDPYTYKDDIPFDSSLLPHEVLIRVAVAGNCHTDGMVVRGEFKDMLKGRGLPLVPSHEPSGTILALGSEAASDKSSTATGNQGPLKVGHRVGALAFKDYCGKCDDCKTGNLKYCADSEAVGLSKDGGMAEYCKVDYRSTVLLPDDLTFEASAPLMCAGATMYTAIKDRNLSKGQHICIIGAGALGHIGVQIAKAQGLRVSVLDSRDAPLELCRALKLAPDVAHNTSKIDPEKPEDVAKVAKAIGGEPDATVVATDLIPAFTLGIWLTKKHGQLQVVGQPADAIPVAFFPVIFRDLRITGSLLSDQKSLKELVDLVAKEKIEIKTTSYSLEEIPKLLSDYGRPEHKGKLVVRVTDEQ